MTSYEHRTEPFSHQRRVFEETRDAHGYALLWEMGCGKSKTIVDTFGWLALRDEVDALFVLSPKCMVDPWVSDQVPTHLPEPLLARVGSHGFDAQRTKTKTAGRSIERALGAELTVVAMNYAGIMTGAGYELAKRMLTERRCLYVLDEATRIKNPRAKRTERILASSVHAPYRRVLTGTPITNSAFDVYEMFRFIGGEDFWRRRELAPYELFCNYFGVWEDVRAWVTRKTKTGEVRRTRRIVRKLVGHKHLDELGSVIQSCSSRVLKEDVLDLPPKTYSKVTFDLSAEQRELYDRIRNELLVEAGDGYVDATFVNGAMLRCQQVACGYVPVTRWVPDADGYEHEVRDTHVVEDNARMDAMIDFLRDCPHQAIIWSVFTLPIDQIVDRLDDAVRYYGATSANDRREAVRRFQAGDVKYFVGNPMAAGEGLTLHAARTVIYYVNGFKYDARLQSEDRAHRIGQAHPVQYVDLVARDTIDDRRVIPALRRKEDVARAVTGDRLREWI